MIGMLRKSSDGQWTLYVDNSFQYLPLLCGTVFEIWSEGKWVRCTMQFKDQAYCADVELIEGMKARLV